MSWKVHILACFAAGLLVLPATANEGPALRVGMQVEREVARPAPSGKVEVRTEPVERASRGDVLLYTLQIVNDGPGPALDARVDDPIPSGTVLVPDSAGGEGARITFSVDGGKTFVTYPAVRPVAGPDGVVRDQPVAPQEYTHVRWTLTDPLDPGQARTAFFKVRVE